MKHWSGLVYLVAGVVVGLLIGTSLTGIAAGGDQPTRADSQLERYTLVHRSEGPHIDAYSVFDAQTGMLYTFSKRSYQDAYYGRVINAVEGWYEPLTIKERAAPQPPSE